MKTTKSKEPVKAVKLVIGKKTNAPISKWLEKLPEGHRQLALKNFKEQQWPDVDLYDCLSGVLNNAFMWELTPEGLKFWNQVYEWAKGQEIPKLPELPKKA